jgi:hypothetical protein
MAVTTLNTAPIYTETPKVSGTILPAVAATAQNNSQGNGTIGGATPNMFLAFSAGADGSYLQKVRFTLSGATANVASTAAVLRVYVSTVNTGSTTSADTWLIQEVNAAAQTPNVVTTLTGATYPIDIPLNFAIPSGYYLLVGISAVSTVANSPVWVVTTYGGDY